MMQPCHSFDFFAGSFRGTRDAMSLHGNRLRRSIVRSAARLSPLAESVVATQMALDGTAWSSSAHSVAASNSRMDLHPTTTLPRFPSPSIPPAGLVALVAAFASVLPQTSSSVMGVIADAASDLSSPTPMRSETPNQALQRTPGFGAQLPGAALIRPAQSRAVLPAMKPGTARAFASRRRAHSRAPGPESLSLGSLGASTRS